MSITFTLAAFLAPILFLFILFSYIFVRTIQIFRCFYIDCFVVFSIRCCFLIKVGLRMSCKK